MIVVCIVVAACCCSLLFCHPNVTCLGGCLVLAN